MVEKWKEQEIVQYLEEQLSNSLFHDDFEANENGLGFDEYFDNCLSFIEEANKKTETLAA